MKYINEFRDRQLAEALAKSIALHAQADRQYHLMEFCGGHTHTIYRHGLPNLLPFNVNMIHGPGCPVCVLPIARVQQDDPNQIRALIPSQEQLALNNKQIFILNATSRHEYSF